MLGSVEQERERVR
jgi:hypothetical protein